MNMDEPKDPLNSLLAELPKVRDDGFTKRVLYRVQLRELRRRTFYFTASCCGIVALALGLAYGRFGSSWGRRLQDSSSIWTDSANLDQLIQPLMAQLQLNNFNTIIGLSAGAIVLVLGINSLLRD